MPQKQRRLSTHWDQFLGKTFLDIFHANVSCLCSFNNQMLCDSSPLLPVSSWPTDGSALLGRAAPDFRVLSLHVIRLFGRHPLPTRVDLRLSLGKSFLTNIFWKSPTFITTNSILLVKPLQFQGQIEFNTVALTSDQMWKREESSSWPCRYYLTSVHYFISSDV